MYRFQSVWPRNLHRLGYRPFINLQCWAVHAGAGGVEVHPCQESIPHSPLVSTDNHRIFLQWRNNAAALVGGWEGRAEHSEHAWARGWNWNRLQNLNVLSCFDFQTFISMKGCFNTSSYSELDIALRLTHSCLLSNARVFFCSVWMC